MHKLIVVGSQNAEGFNDSVHLATSVDLENAAMILAPLGRNKALYDTLRQTDVTVEGVVDGIDFSPGAVYVLGHKLEDIRDGGLEEFANWYGPPSKEGVLIGHVRLADYQEIEVLQQNPEGYTVADPLMDNLARLYGPQVISVVANGNGYDGGIGVSQTVKFGGKALVVYNDLHPLEEAHYNSEPVKPHRAAFMGYPDSRTEVLDHLAPLHAMQMLIDYDDVADHIGSVETISARLNELVKE